MAIVLPDLGGGGAEKLHLNLAEEWTRCGASVEFVLMRRRGDFLPLVPNDVSLVALDVDRIRDVVGPLRAYLRRSRPDVTLAAMWPLTCCTTLAWLGSGRVGRLFLSDHTQLSVSRVHETRAPLWALRASLATTYPLATGVIAVSGGVKADLCALGRLPPRRVKVIYNPAAVGTKLPDRGQDARRWKSSARHRILCVGKLKEQKDHETAIRAFARLPRTLDAEMVILGEGPLMMSLVDLARALGVGDRVRLPGFTKDPSPWYATADLFVLSSRWEGFANVIVEALSYGVPVVSTDCASGPAEILEGGRHGRLVPIQDPDAMATAIAMALEAPPDREALFRRSRDFAVDVIAAQYLEYMLGDSSA